MEVEVNELRTKLDQLYVYVLSASNKIAKTKILEVCFGQIIHRDHDNYEELVNPLEIKWGRVHLKYEFHSQSKVCCRLHDQQIMTAEGQER